MDMNEYIQTPQGERIKILQSLMPEIFDEGKIDWEKLKATLGEDINFSNERYVLNWAGKSDAFRVMQRPTSATLSPCREESVDFDNTQNIFIEGENMEVLKVLQKSYFGKVKMIYIDPPYNTGNDSFVYPDKFSESKEEYMRRVGDKDEDGYMVRDAMFHKNSKENGQYHSNWLNMMMPRLYLAKSLLREDGVIFVSIDDNEVHNLRLLMNEIFGEENYLGTISNTNNPKGRSDDKYIATAHEYVIVFAKLIDSIKWRGFKLTEEVIKRYNKTDEKGEKYREIDLRKTGENDLREDRPNLFYYFYYNEATKDLFPSKEIIEKEAYIRIKPQREDGREGNWRWEIGTSIDNLQLLIPKFMPNRKIWGIMTMDYLNKRGLLKPTSSWCFKDVNSERGSEEFVELGFNKRTFPKPKPIGTIKRCLMLNTEKDDLIIDFFAGSSTTAHAVMQLNKEDGGNRKYICIQLPEKCDEKSEAYKAGYKTIAEISKERIRRASEKIRAEIESKQAKQKEQLQFDDSETIPMPDLGFKVFKLIDSNFKQWREIKASEKGKWIEQTIEFLDPVTETATTANMVYELLLKYGKSLNSSIDHKNSYFAINGKELYLMLETATQEVVDAILAEKPNKVIALDRLFMGNDQLKTNTVLQMRDAGIEFKTI